MQALSEKEQKLEEQSKNILLHLCLSVTPNKPDRHWLQLKYHADFSFALILYWAIKASATELVEALLTLKPCIIMKYIEWAIPNRQHNIIFLLTTHKGILDPFVEEVLIYLDNNMNILTQTQNILPETKAIIENTASVMHTLKKQVIICRAKENKVSEKRWLLFQTTPALLPHELVLHIDTYLMDAATQCVGPGKNK